MAKINFSKKLENLIASFLILGTILFIILFIWQNRFFYQQNFDPQRLANFYSYSQFSEKQPLFTISDDDLYAYAGWHYLATGDLKSLNIEHPPLGKYFIGLSIKLFNNQNIGHIFWGILFLYLTYLISFQISNNRLIAITIPFFLILEPLFRQQMIHSLLDLPQATFILAYLLILPRVKNSFWSTLILGVCLGAVAAIKFPALAFILSLATLLAFIFYRQQPFICLFKLWCFINFIAIFVFTVTYFSLLSQAGFTSWIHVLIQATKIHLNHVPLYSKGVIFRVLFFNQWPRWWGQEGIQKVTEWQYTWPLVGISFLLSPFLFIKKNFFRKNPSIFFFTWISLLFLASRLFFPTYLLPILPFGFLFFMLIIQLFLRQQSNFSN